MPTFFQLKTYITYWLDAVDEHALHSPFFYDFYTKVIQGNTPLDTSVINDLRMELLQNNSPITIEDLGAGSHQLKHSIRKINQIARTSVSPAKYSKLYLRIVSHFAHKNILELGTSLGINTLYLAQNKNTTVITFEGSQSIADRARSVFKKAGNSNIQLIEGNIDHTLPTYLQKIPSIDFAFIDANHRYEPTLKYFECLIKKIHKQSIIILDDIHYSPAMERAWLQLKKHPMVYASADVYRCGILFFDPSLNKQHVVLQF